jgi:hypothetical protein
LTLLWPQGAWHAYVVAAALAAGNTFFNPTVQAIIPSLTTEEQRAGRQLGGLVDGTTRTDPGFGRGRRADRPDRQLDQPSR